MTQITEHIEIWISARPLTPSVSPWLSEGTSWQRFDLGPSCSCWWRWHRHVCLTCDKRWERSMRDQWDWYEHMRDRVGHERDLCSIRTRSLPCFHLEYFWKMSLQKLQCRTDRNSACSLRGALSSSCSCFRFSMEEVIRMDVSLRPNLETSQKHVSLLPCVKKRTDLEEGIVKVFRF